MPKVAMGSFGANEAVVAKLSKRVGVTTSRAKGFTVSLLYYNLNLVLGMILDKEQKLKSFTMKSRMNREVHVR